LGLVKKIGPINSEVNKKMTIEERIKCEKCGKTTAVLMLATRTGDEDGPIDPESGGNIVYFNEKLWLSYKCRNCWHQFIKTINGL